MTFNRLAVHTTLALTLGLSFTGIAMAQSAASAPKAAPAGKAAPKAVKKAPVKAPAVFAPEAATPEQIEAAERVFYGPYECEFNQAIDIQIDPKYPAYVDVKHLKATYLMKPVLSTTGAIRLEDVHGETLMVQIANKSMLLNVKTGHRLVDDCVSSKQRELIAAAKQAKAAEAAASAAK
jgi:hypothetical protein